MSEPIRIANCSGFFGDRLSAAQEMVDGGPIDVLTGDWLAELTMLILVRQKMKHGNGYARTFLTQMETVLGTCVDRGIAVVSNAGGLDPVGLGSALAELGDELGIPLRIGVVSGDDLMPRLAELVAEGEEFVNLDTGERLGDVGAQPITANAYLGAEPITRALAAGADVVVTGRVTDAALVIGPAAWRHGWDYAAARAGDQATLDALAGALVAGHVIECGAQATGGNYAFFTDVPGLEHPGFPIAEVASDGSAVITKHAGSGGMVTVGTVTAQLLYEIGGPAVPESRRDGGLRDHPPRAGGPGPRARQRHARRGTAGTAQGRDELPGRLPQLPDARHDRGRCRCEGRPRPAHHGGRGTGAGEAARRGSGGPGRGLVARRRAALRRARRRRQGRPAAAGRCAVVPAADREGPGRAEGGQALHRSGDRGDAVLVSGPVPDDSAGAGEPVRRVLAHDGEPRRMCRRSVSLDGEAVGGGTP